MTQPLTAYMPLSTYPEALPDADIRAALAFAVGLGCAMRVTAFAVDIPQVASPLGNLLIDVKGLVQAAEHKSAEEAARLQGLVHAAAPKAVFTTRKVQLAGILDAAVAEARLQDLVVLPMPGTGGAAQDLTQAVVFGAGRPAVVVPGTAQPGAISHLAVAWDGSRVAARALGDALPLLAPGGRISVLTVTDEKPLQAGHMAETLASALQGRGYDAQPLHIGLAGRKIGVALQEAAIGQGAHLLAMGGFGHSRVRDFVLGGATQGVLGHLSLPVLLSH